MAQLEIILGIGRVNCIYVSVALGKIHSITLELVYFITLARASRNSRGEAK